MYTAYLDETGDDGLSNSPSLVFCLSAIYMSENSWSSNFQILKAFRKNLRSSIGLSLKEELHTSEFIKGKAPYNNIAPLDRKKVIFDYCNMISGLDLQVINVLIDKRNVSSPSYPVLENALTYLTQRLETDLTRTKQSQKFIMFIDDGRVGPMTRIVRKMQVYNIIPSQFSGNLGNQTIKNIVEDPILKDSKQSYFIQVVDCIALMTYLYYSRVDSSNQDKIKISNRISALLTDSDIEEIYKNILARIFNKRASTRHGLGLVIYP